MRSNRGFTLIETLIATAILVPGLVAIGLLFAHVIGTTAAAQQTTAATMVITDKMEELRSLPLASLTVGGSLNPASPTTGYYDYVTIGSNGAMTTSTTSSPAAYMRLWQVSGTNPKTITIVVHAVRSSAAMGRRLEATRSSTMVTDTF